MKTGSLHAIVVKKTHSIKNNLLCTNNLRIVWLSSTYKGHVHDKKICDEEPLLLPKGIRFWQDTGFIGHKPDGVEICMPKKKPKGKELTCVEKQENKRISGVRIKVEHAIGGMKKCRIVKERFRCHKFGFGIFGDGAVPPKEDVYLCDSEVACMLKVSRRTLGEYRSNGTLPYYVLGGKVLYKRSEIEQVLEREYRSVGKARGSG